MSLASAQRNLAQANRKALKIQGEAKMGQSLLETASQGLQMGMAIGDSVFDLTEKKQAWKDYSAGREYMGLDKADAPTLKQRLFKKPEDVYSDRITVGDKEYTAKEIQSVGTLASSKNKALYEKMMDGNLASSVGRERIITPETLPPPLPDPPSKSPRDYISKMTDDAIQQSINEGFGVGTENRLTSTSEAKANFYKYMPKGASIELGEEYFQSLIDERQFRRDNPLKNSDVQAVKSSNKELGF